MTSGLEMEWDYSGRKGRDGKNKKVDNANKNRKRGELKNSKRWGNEWIRGKGARGTHRAQVFASEMPLISMYTSLWSPYVIGQTIIFLPCDFFLFFPRLISAVGHWMSTILPHMVWPWCKFRMQV